MERSLPVRLVVRKCWGVCQDFLHVKASGAGLSSWGK